MLFLEKKAVSGILLTLLLISMLALAFKIQPVEASGTIYIRADGTIDPPTAPIQRNGDLYTLTNNINDSIVVGRSNIIIDGNGYTLQGTGSDNGIDLSDRINVTIQHLQVQGFYCGIFSVTPGYGGNSSNRISRNNITNNYFGIALALTADNTISENSITNNYYGIFLSYETVIYPQGGGHFYLVYYDSVFGNNITNNYYGIYLWCTDYGMIYHNNFIGNHQQVYCVASTNTWDLGYPLGGNYWSDYTGNDSYSGPYQNVSGSDGIGDTPYIIDVDNVDHYPLMTHDVAVTNIVANCTWVYQGHSANINVTVLNKKQVPENVIVTLYYNITVNKKIGTQVINLLPGETQTIIFVWNTIGVEYGHNYTITAVASIAYPDADPTDNILANGKIKVRILGDINGDGKVDLDDVLTEAMCFGSFPGHPNWNLTADINCDNKVDLGDFFSTVLNFGKTCSP